MIHGCASGPSGGAETPNVANRFTVRLTTREAIKPTYYYAVAFDDNPGDDAGSVYAGPVAIVGETPILNRVVGGNWRVAVVWNNYNFRIFRRAVPTDPATEENIPTTAIISRRASANFIEFTLDLDARLNNGTYVLPRNSTNTAPARFDVNFVTTDRVDVVGSDVKAVDSAGRSATAQPILNQLLAGTTTPTPYNDASGDINDFAIEPGDFGRMDVTSLSIQVNRTDGAS